jgi:hypothetical protein
MESFAFAATTCAGAQTGKIANTLAAASAEENLNIVTPKHPAAPGARR